MHFWNFRHHTFNFSRRGFLGMVLLLLKSLSFYVEASLINIIKWLQNNLYLSLTAYSKIAASMKKVQPMNQKSWTFNPLEWGFLLWKIKTGNNILFCCFRYHTFPLNTDWTGQLLWWSGEPSWQNKVIQN